MKPRTLFLRFTRPGWRRFGEEYVPPRTLATIPCKKVSVGCRALFVQMHGWAKGRRIAVLQETRYQRAGEPRMHEKWYLTDEGRKLLKAGNVTSFICWQVV